MKRLYSLIFTIFIVGNVFAFGQSVNAKVFDLLDLNHVGLEKVKLEYDQGNLNEAAVQLLKYYKQRTSFVHPDLNLSGLEVSKTDKKWANDALNHVFFAHKGYQPSYFYGDDINWEYWPVKDNELRWQLHRMKWWQPMGKLYYSTKDEKYAKEWVFQYLDWIKKNPLEEYVNRQQVGSDVDLLPNSSFSWRPLEVSHRIADQIEQFMLFIDSEHFTPEFLTFFLVNYNEHVEHIIKHYSERGNHLLFEAQRVLYAGIGFSEFKRAKDWRASGINILVDQMKEQVYDDGGQFELDLGYHLGAINIFVKAYKMAMANGLGHEFSQEYLETIHSMIKVTMNTYFPNYTNPTFSDAKLGSKAALIRNYQDYSQIFPNDKQILYFATEGKQGEAPTNLSTAFKTTGFYVFRNGWDNESTQMVLKAGPKAFWHNQPDNGTFELYVNQRNFFPDSGSYIYGGDSTVLELRNWFRQTRVHNTMTLNRENLQSDSKCIYWHTSPKEDVLVVENNSYPELKHRRTVYFVDQAFFVIHDEAIGEATGDISVHFNLVEQSNPSIDSLNNSFVTNFDDGNNLQVYTFGPKDLNICKEQGWVSYSYRQRLERDILSLNAKKDSSESISFITVILPTNNLQAKVTKLSESKNTIELRLGKKKYNLKKHL